MSINRMRKYHRPNNLLAVYTWKHFLWFNWDMKLTLYPQVPVKFGCCQFTFAEDK